MGIHTLVWQKFGSTLGIEIQPEDFSIHLVGCTNAEILRHYLGNQLSENEIIDYTEQKEKMYRDTFSPVLEEVKGLTPFLKQSREAGIRIALGTTGYKPNIDFILDGIRVRPYFDAVLGAEDIQHGKPDPEIFLTAARRLGVSPRNCIVFEDSISGIEAGRRAGMRVIALATTHPAEMLSSLPGVVQVVQDFSALEPTLLHEQIVV